MAFAPYFLIFVSSAKPDAGDVPIFRKLRADIARDQTLRGAKTSAGSGRYRYGSIIDHSSFSSSNIAQRNEAFKLFAVFWKSQTGLHLT